MHEAQIRSLLAQWPHTQGVTLVEPLGMAGGFSGATFWRVTAGGQRYCLRRWPSSHPTPERLQLIDNVLTHVAAEGYASVPVPCVTCDGHTSVNQKGQRWQLTRWLSGTADFHQSPNDDRLSNAMVALARFHLAASTFSGLPSDSVESPGLKSRRDRMQSLLNSEGKRIQQELSTSKPDEFSLLASQLARVFHDAAPAVLRRLEGSTHLRFHLQPVIRDIWHDHVLFEGDQVAGLIDFGALSIDTVSTDIARLLGSLVGDDAAAWQRGLDSYQDVRPLTVNEIDSLQLFDQANVLVSGMQWLSWIYVEDRCFPNLDAIYARLQTTLVRANHLGTAPR